jgi:hypothetical protein
MNFLRPSLRIAGLLAVATAAGWLTGCGNVFVPKHKVLVDAIAAKGPVFTASGTSYRLVARPAVVSGTPARVELIKACVDAALGQKGMFEAPSNVPPDIFIEVSYGVDATPRVDASARETFLQMSARTNPGKSLERATGVEIWDVRVAVLGIAGRIETAMPLLSTVAADNLGADTKFETKREVPQNEPAIAAVRSTAIKALEGGAAVAPAAGPEPKKDAAAAVTPATTK